MNLSVITHLDRKGYANNVFVCVCVHLHLDMRIPSPWPQPAKNSVFE